MIFYRLQLRFSEREFIRIKALLGLIFFNFHMNSVQFLVAYYSYKSNIRVVDI